MPIFTLVIVKSILILLSLFFLSLYHYLHCIEISTSEGTHEINI